MHSGPRRRGPHRRGRGRRRLESGEWSVEAPIARFIEPAVLLALRNGSSHGYDLAEAVGDLIGMGRVDYGNLYRLLRSLEADGLVSSKWNDELAGRSKRVYELAPEGAELLEVWITALESTQDRLAGFLRTYHEGKT